MMEREELVVETYLQSGFNRVSAHKRLSNFGVSAVDSTADAHKLEISLFNGFRVQLSIFRSFWIVEVEDTG